jgi:hypothetical protein
VDWSVENASPDVKEPDTLAGSPDDLSLSAMLLHPVLGHAEQDGSQAGPISPAAAFSLPPAKVRT